MKSIALGLHEQKIGTAAGAIRTRARASKCMAKWLVLSFLVAISVAALLHAPDSLVQTQKCRRRSLPDTAHTNTSKTEALAAVLVEATSFAESETMVAYYQCFSRPRAAEMVIKLWRQAYPEASVYMVNDGGNNKLQELAEKYKADYTYSNRSSTTRAGLHFADARTSIVFVQRILDCARHASWVMLLEDDVHVLNPVTISSLHHDLNGDNPAEKLRSVLVEVIDKVRKIPIEDTHYGGCGGSVLRGAFLRYMQRKGEWKQHIKMLSDAVQNDSRPSLASDELLSSLILMANGTIGGYPGFVEKNRWGYRQKLARCKIEVLHQQKDYYDKDPNV